MVIMLFIFVILFIPIRFCIKIYAKPEEGIAYSKLFFYHLFIIDAKLFIHNNSLYYKIGRNKPGELILKIPFKLSENKLNLLRVEKVSITTYMGVDPLFSTFGTILLRFIEPYIEKLSKTTEIELKSIPIYFSSSIHLKARVGVFTNLFKIITSLIINSIIKLFKSKKEKDKNAIQQSN